MPSLPRAVGVSELSVMKAVLFPVLAKVANWLYEIADGGTLFLDENGDLDLTLQSKF
jgi:DNA-binding NtrC family response regulator